MVIDSTFLLPEITSAEPFCLSRRKNQNNNNGSDISWCFFFLFFCGQYFGFAPDLQPSHHDEAQSSPGCDSFPIVAPVVQHLLARCVCVEHGALCSVGECVLESGTPCHMDVHQCQQS